MASWASAGSSAWPHEAPILKPSPSSHERGAGACDQGVDGRVRRPAAEHAELVAADPVRAAVGGVAFASREPSRASSASPAG